ncbi:MAG: TonB-dependent receptor plug domain-containing protein [Gemmatimonadota bacterium]
MRLRAPLYSLLLCFAVSGQAAGQIRIVGRVIDDLTEVPLSQAQISLLAPDGSTLTRGETSELGTFEFQVRNVRAVRLSVRRFGYQANTTPLLYFDVRKFFQVEVRLDPEAILLAPLEVIYWSPRPENALHEAFKRRVETGLGIYITREEVETRNPLLVSDLLREVPGLDFRTSAYGTRPSVRMVRAAGMACVTQIFLDGFLMNGRAFSTAGFAPIDLRIDDVVSPNSVEGIEIYRGLSTVPPEFLNPDADCGVIAIWTRRGG